MDGGAGLFHFVHHLFVLAVGEIAAVGNHRNDDRARRVPSFQPSGDFENRVEQRRAGARLRPQEADGVLEQLGVRRVVGEDPRSIRETDDGNLVALRHRADERLQCLANARDEAFDAALSSTRMAMSIGSVARDTRSTSRAAPIFADDEVTRAKPFDGLTLLVDRADKHRALARRLRADDGVARAAAHAKAIPRARARARRSRNVVRMKSLTARGNR